MNKTLVEKLSKKVKKVFLTAALGISFISTIPSINRNTIVADAKAKKKDKKAPKITNKLTKNTIVLSPGQKITLGGKLKIKDNVTKLKNIKLKTVVIDKYGYSYSSVAKTNKKGKVTIKTAGLEEGKYKIKVTATDKAKNKKSKVVKTFKIKSLTNANESTNNNSASNNSSNNNQSDNASNNQTLPNTTNEFSQGEKVEETLLGIYNNEEYYCDKHYRIYKYIFENNTKIQLFITNYDYRMIDSDWKNVVEKELSRNQNLDNNEKETEEVLLGTYNDNEYYRDEKYNLFYYKTYYGPISETESGYYKSKYFLTDYDYRVIDENWQNVVDKFENNIVENTQKESVMLGAYNNIEYYRDENYKLYYYTIDSLNEDEFSNIIKVYITDYDYREIDENWKNVIDKLQTNNNNEEEKTNDDEIIDETKQESSVEYLGEMYDSVSYFKDEKYRIFYYSYNEDLTSRKRIYVTNYDYRKVDEDWEKVIESINNNEFLLGEYEDETYYRDNNFYLYHLMSYTETDENTNEVCEFYDKLYLTEYDYKLVNEDWQEAIKTILDNENAKVY